MPYHYERLRENHLPDLAQFFEKIFGKKLPVDYFLKKYSRLNPSPYYYAFLVFCQKEIVAYSGAIPYYLQKGGQKELSSQLLDVGILPNHRGQGIFKELHGRIYNVLQEDGIRSIFGCPNQNLHRGLFKGMNWQKVHQIQRFHIPVQNRIAARLRYQSNCLHKKPPQVYFQPLLSDHPLLPASIDTPAFIAPFRNADYYNYKQSFGGSFFVAIEGIRFWIKTEGQVLFIGDMETPASAQELRGLLDILGQYARKAGIREMIFQSSPGTSLVHFFQELYPAQPSWTLGYDDFSSQWDMQQLRFVYGDFDSF